MQDLTLKSWRFLIWLPLSCKVRKNKLLHTTTGHLDIILWTNKQQTILGMPKIFFIYDYVSPHNVVIVSKPSLCRPRQKSRTCTNSLHIYLLGNICHANCLRRSGDDDPSPRPKSGWGTIADWEEGEYNFFVFVSSGPRDRVWSVSDRDRTGRILGWGGGQ